MRRLGTLNVPSVTVRFPIAIGGLALAMVVFSWREYRDLT